MLVSTISLDMESMPYPPPVDTMRDAYKNIAFMLNLMMRLSKIHSPML